MKTYQREVLMPSTRKKNVSKLRRIVDISWEILKLAAVLALGYVCWRLM